MVRVTKWTGRDSIPGIQIRPQIVTLDEESSMEIEIRNPFSDKPLFLQKQDKVACLSVLSGPAKPGLFNRDVSPESFETRDKRWFRVSSVVLHRKGTDDHRVPDVFSFIICCLLFDNYPQIKVRINNFQEIIFLHNSIQVE